MITTQIVRRLAITKALYQTTIGMSREAAHQYDIESYAYENWALNSRRLQVCTGKITSRIRTSGWANSHKSQLQNQATFARVDLWKCVYPS